jgi:hypothetical protein
MSSPSYYALRIAPGAPAPRWWACARQSGPAAPRAIRALLAGRSRVELSAEEAEHVIAWARGLDGWGGDGLAPLRIYPELVA